MFKRLQRVGVGSIAAVAVVLGLLVPDVARGQDMLSGHFGFELPLVTRSGSETTSIGNQFKIGFPTGITIQTSDKVSFDLQFVPTIQHSPFLVTLTVEPGVLYALPSDYAAGLRMSFDVDQSSWGFTPLLHKKFGSLGSSPVFGELIVPLRFQESNNSIGIGVHLGLGF